MARAFAVSSAIFATFLTACGDPKLAPAPGADAAEDAGTDLADVAEDAAGGTDAENAGTDAENAGTDATLAGTDAAGDAGTDALAADVAGTDAQAIDSAADVSSGPSGCGTVASTGTKTATVSFGGGNRSYFVHVPTAYDGSKPLAVIIALHGLTDDAGKMEKLTGFDSLADKNGFLVVYPDGIGGSWNAGNCCGTAQTTQVDDIGFLLAVVKDFSAHYCVDPKRIFATGFSNGAYMAQRLGCEKADIFAAIAPVSGEINLKSCKPSRPLPVLEFHGNADFIVPFGGGGLTGGAWSVDETIAFWKENGGCTDAKPANISKNGNATCTGYSACKGGAAVELCVLDGCGHQWPSSPEPASLFGGKMSTDIDASAAIWAFFAAHPLP